VSKGWVQIVQGWFFPDIDPDEPAWYLDYYFDKDGNCKFELYGCYVIVDFWSHIKDYEMGFITGTIAENFKIPEEIQVNEIEV